MVGEAVLQVVVVLLGEECRRRDEGDLVSGARGGVDGAHRHFGFAEANVAANDAVHRLRAGKVGEDGVNRSLLVGGGGEGEFGGKRGLGGGVVRNGDAGGGFAFGVEGKQFGGGVVQAGADFAPRALPAFAAQFVQRRAVRVAAAVAGDEVDVGGGDVEFGAFGVGDGNEFVAVVFEFFEAEVAADAKVGVDDGGAGAQVLQAADEGGGVAAAVLAVVGGDGRGVQVGFGEVNGIAIAEAVAVGRDGVMQAEAARAEALLPLFAAAFAGKVQGEVAALVYLRLPLLFARAGVAAEGNGGGVFFMGRGGNGGEAGEGVGGREPEGVGRQEAVFAQGVGAAVALFAPVGVLFEQRGQVVAGEVQAVWRQVVEKRRGVVVEER